MLSENNLALQPGVQITVSVSEPTGGGARDPRVLLNDTAHRLDQRSLSDFVQDRTYDTFDGRNQASGEDWYALEFPEPAAFNCIEMTMGFPYPDGGWWISLRVEVREEPDGPWRPVENLQVMPPYNFDDTRDERRPYETYALTFDEVIAKSVRLIGRPGGLAQFTSMARIAVYHRDLSRWNPTYLPNPPVPYLLQLIPPHVVWDFSQHFVKLTGLMINFPLMEFYLDENRYQQRWQWICRNYQGQPDLWLLVGDSIGWDAWQRNATLPLEDLSNVAREPYVYTWFHNTLAIAVAPIVVGDEMLGRITTHPVVLKQEIDWTWHQRYAQEHQIPWSEYLAALKRSPHMTLEQLEGAAALMGMIANTIANLAHRNLYLKRELDEARKALSQRSQWRNQIVRRAIDFMQENLESPIRVVDVAKAVALSPSYFCTLFTEQMGRNPRDFLIDLRIERAKEYLAHTDMSIVDVCALLGYNPSYFSRLFKRRVGCSPGQYARRMRSS